MYTSSTSELRKRRRDLKCQFGTSGDAKEADQATPNWHTNNTQSIILKRKILSIQIDFEKVFQKKRTTKNSLKEGHCQSRSLQLHLNLL